MIMSKTQELKKLCEGSDPQVGDVCTVDMSVIKKKGLTNE
jgi:hypothetical protein